MVSEQQGKQELQREGGDQEAPSYVETWSRRVEVQQKRMKQRLSKELEEKNRGIGYT